MELPLAMRPGWNALKRINGGITGRASRIEK
jgi:hypothetical protein